ncbi:unnamed protein product [Cladocopium goreaui]|uniref:Galactosylceramidase (Galactosylceramidase) n=1 Tax=Cladocopium goreaui TaxID=2562237 RepID=A0A9P1CW59_9DINO|nr:unnamed protein product [Cladocopium goreaui]
MATAALMQSLKLFAWVIAWLASSVPAVALSLDSAELVHDYTILLLRFNSKAREFAENGTDVPQCDSILATATVQKIGTLPSCQWFMEGQVLQVRLGEGPSIAPGQAVSTLASALAAKDADPLTAAGSLTASVTTKLSALAPEASLQIWPPQAKPCSSVILSGAQSTGAAGRAFVVAWSFGSADVATGTLQAYLTAASASNSLKLEIPGSALSAAVSSSSASLVQFEIILQITNWLGLSHNTSDILTVDRSGIAVPLVYPASITNRRIQSNQAVTFSITTRYADESACGTAVSLPSNPISESWSYLNSSSWLPLESVVSSDSAREPWKVDLPAYSFAPGSSHQLKATASYGSGTVREHVFGLEVSAAQPPIIRISGPYVVSETCSFTLDASASSDPVAPGTNDLVFYWSCASGTGTFNCRTLSNFGPGTWILQNGTGSSGPLLIVDGNQLLEGNYTFTLQVIRQSDQAVSSSTWTVDVTKTASISISISPSWYEGQPVSTQANNDYSPSSTAFLRTGQGCGDKEALWSWALVEADSPFNILTYLDSPSNASETSYSATDLLYDYLLPSQRYALALMEQTDQTPSSLEQADMLGLSFSRTVPFLADAPPAGGGLTCVPMQGVAATTEFFITSSGWYDEDMSNLSFAFYRFPLPSGVALASDGSGGVSVTGTFSPPEVEWKDTSSANHWMNLGGVCLGYSQLPLQLRLPAGQHMLAVVVQDSQGAVSSTFMAGPLVTVSPSVSEVELGLSVSLVSNNAEIILSMLDATLTEQVDTSKEVQAFATAASIADLSETGLCRLSRVANNLLADATPATAESISGAVSTVLADIVQIPSVGVNRLLSVVFSVATSYSAAELDEVILRTQQLNSLAMELGNAILATVSVHGSQNLSYVDATGRGLQVYVAKKRVRDLPYDGISVGGLRMPDYAFQTAPLLSYLLEVGPACSTVEVQLTTWLKSNPYSWANNVSNESTHVATLVTTDATVVVLEIRHCLSQEILNLTNRQLTLSLPLPDMPTEPPPSGYLYEATCAVFDPDKLQWTRQGLRSKQLQETVECTVASGNGVAIPFTVFYMPMPVPEEDEPVNVGIMVVAIIVFFLCLGAVAWSNGQKGADKVAPEDDSIAPPEKAEESASAVQEVPEASPVVPDPVAPAELAEASVPVEPQASVPRSGPGNEAIEAHFQDWEKEVSPKSTTTPAAGPGPPEVASSPAPGQSVEVRVDTNDSAPSNLPRHPEDLPGQPDVPER